MKLFSKLLLALSVIGLAAPAYSAIPTPASRELRPDLTPRIVCGNYAATAWAVDDHILVTAYHLTKEADVSCTLPATHERAYIIDEDQNADIAYLYVDKARPWHFEVNCGGYTKGDTYYAAGWPKEGYKITTLTASGLKLAMGGFWWNQEIFYGPQQTEHGQSGGPIVGKLGYVTGIVNGGVTEQNLTFSTSRALADTALCR